MIAKAVNLHERLVATLSDALTCKFERPAFEAALALLREAQEP